MSGQFTVFVGKNDQFYFHLKAGNGEIILTSEGYTTKANCLNGIQSVQINSFDDKHYERKLASNNKYYFNLKASNGQIVGSSQLYLTEQSRDLAIESVKKNVVTATILDLTKSKLPAD